MHRIALESRQTRACEASGRIAASSIPPAGVIQAFVNIVADKTVADKARTAFAPVTFIGVKTVSALMAIMSSFQAFVDGTVLIPFSFGAIVLDCLIRLDTLVVPFSRVVRIGIGRVAIWIIAIGRTVAIRKRPLVAIIAVVISLRIFRVDVAFNG